jgi:hypothetical protein
MINQLPDQQERKSSLIYNPERDDFTVYYDINGDQNPVAFTIPAGEIKEFDEPIASHIKKHLVDHMLNKKGAINGNVELAKEKYLSEIEVKI